MICHPESQQSKINKKKYSLSDEIDLMIGVSNRRWLYLQWRLIYLCVQRAYLTSLFPEKKLKKIASLPKKSVYIMRNYASAKIKYTSPIKL